MRQAGPPPTGTWTGPSHAGVKSPEPIVIADPSARFHATAQRLEQLATGHPMEAWLRFMAALAHAQRTAAGAMALPSPDARRVAQAVEARLPPLAADGHRRDAAWRDGLRQLLAHMRTQDLPAAAIEAIVALQQRDDAALEQQADSFLRGEVALEDAAGAVFIAAALQVYFAVSAARLRANDLRLLEERALCPCCGSPSVSGVITATGITPGTRYLHCSLCSTAWNHMRAVCITCGGTRHLSVQAIEGDSGVVKAETCGECHTYAKLLYQVQDTRLDAFADDLATFGLDLLVAEAGFARHAPNPFVLMG